MQVAYHASNVNGDAASTIVQAALAGSGDVAYSWDLVGDSIVWAGDISAMLGLDGRAVVANGDAYHELINPEDLEIRLKALSRHFTDREPFDCEYRLRTALGGFSWVHERGQAKLSETGRPLRMTGILRIINMRKQHEVLLEQRANYDELTGHFNMSRLREAVDRSLAYNLRYDLTGAYLAVGIDKMAMINQAYGHEVADAVIVGVAQRLESCIRTTDIIGRIGGDRFGIVLDNCSEDGLAVAAEKILDSFRRHSIDTPVGPVQVTVSVGGVVYPGLIRTAHDLMAGAEGAMQEAKGRGRNCFALFALSEEQRTRQRESISMGERMVQALRDDRIAFAYQPVVLSRTGEVSYYETLVRMVEGQGTVVPAGAFVPVAERLGLVRELDRRVLELAVEDLNEDPEVTLALNISSLTASDRSWLRTLVGLVMGRPDVASRLIVEITETAALQDFEDTARFIGTVRDLGCKVALDDFGSGYTSFRQLKALTVDIVKIDGSFVRGVSDNPENQLFIRTLLNLANGFRLKTVAECVETAEDARILMNEGIEFMQGWHYGRPSMRKPWLASRLLFRQPAFGDD